MVSMFLNNKFFCSVGVRAGLCLLGALCVMLGQGCAENDPTGPGDEYREGNNFGGQDMSFGFYDQGGGGSPDPEPFIPEIEEDFDFSRPAIVGEEIYVANETLNSVAAINSSTLAIRTIPVGFGPTVVVGPAEGVGGEDARVAVLNEGSYTVSLLAPARREGVFVEVMKGANALTGNDAGTAFVAWYDDTLHEEGERRGDLSSVTLIKEGTSYEIAVGFHVRDVLWSGDRVLVITDDGVSVIELEGVDGDRRQVPVAVLPAELIPGDPRDLEILVDGSGSYALARLASFSGVVLTTLATGEQVRVDLPEIPTDIDFIPGDQVRALIMQPYRGAGLVLDLPDGAVNVAAFFADAVVPSEEPSDDMGRDADMNAGEDLDAAPDMIDDMQLSLDLDLPDLATDAGGEDMAVEEDMDSSLGALLDGVEGVHVIEVPGDERLGAAAVSVDGGQAFLYTTIASQSKIGLLYDVATQEQSTVFFEKGIKGVVADDEGSSFLVFHSRDERVPQDPILGSWGLSIVDVRSATPRLVITEHEPWVATLWSVEGFAPRAYVIFKRPVDEAFIEASHRDVLGVNLETFRVETFRVPSLPEGIGAIGSVGKVYINQKHPQGRMTFVDVRTNQRQTVTGYQLNAGID